jgi:hypothetical protein
MNWDAVGIWDTLVLLLLAIADLVLIALLRQRRARHARMERMMMSLCVAIRKENDREELAEERWWRRAS